MLSSIPVTQRDLAQACSVHPSTICLALKNSPSIPEKTRERVRRAAAELGYQPNAAARNLAFLRTERKAGGSLPIAWINQETDREHWRRDAEARGQWQAARRRAAELGYHLEEIWACEPGMTAARLGQIVRARGIDAALFPVHRRFDFSLLGPAWKDVASVGLNDHRLGEWIDLVCPDYFQNMQLILRRLRQIGCTRPGFALAPQDDAGANGLAHGCFLREQSMVADLERVPVCLLEGGDAFATLTAWFHDHRPDAVICRSREIACQMEAHGWPAIVVQWRPAGSDCAAGLDEGAAEVAATAVECVVAKSRRFEKGCGGATRLHLVKGTWHQRAQHVVLATGNVA